MSSGEGWSRRGLAAALAPALLSPGLLAACVSPRARRLVSINLLDSQPTPSGPPDLGAKLETAFDDAKRMVVPVYINGQPVRGGDRGGRRV
jgi:hypothetical protein